MGRGWPGARVPATARARRRPGGRRRAGAEVARWKQRQDVRDAERSN